MSKTAIASPDPDDNKPELNANVPAEAATPPKTPVDEDSTAAAKQGGYDWESMILPDDGAGDIRTTEVPGVPRLSRPPNTQFFRTRDGLSGVISAVSRSRHRNSTPVGSLHCGIRLLWVRRPWHLSVHRFDRQPLSCPHR